MMARSTPTSLSLPRACAMALGLIAAACQPGPTLEFDAGAPVLDAEGNSLGSLAFSTGCADPANEAMRRGMGLLHHMTYVEAEQAFAVAADADPGCALAYWGQALSFVHPLWPDVPSPEAFTRGAALLERAREVGGADERERAYIGALEAYYRDASDRTEPERLASYAEAWVEVAAAYPRDSEAALFKALLMIGTASNADKTHAQREAAGAIGERVLAVIPDHPGAHHYVIHAYDVPPLAERAIAAARNYGQLAPENAHALHMTSHIFTRVGSWQESINYNERSAAAALKHPINGQTSHHYLHALDYLAYARLQQGDVQGAEDVLATMRGLEGPVVQHAASAYTFAAVPARIALENGEWNQAASAPVRWPEQIPWDAFPHLEAIGQFARAIGHARVGHLAQAEQAIQRLDELHAAAGRLPDAYDWATQVEIQAIGARAWVAYATEDYDRAVTLMRQAADLESTTEKNPVTPGEVLPARELLGDMLLELGRYAEASAAYRDALTRTPNRFNSLYGAGRAAELGGNPDEARDYYQRLLDIAVDDTPSDRVRHARRYLTEV